MKQLSRGVGFLRPAGASMALIMILAGILPPAFGSAVQPAPVLGPPQQDETLDTHSVIASMISCIDGDLVGRHIQKLQDHKTRYAYRGDKCFQAAEYIAGVFQQNGLDVEYEDFVYKDFTMRNIVAEKPGAATAEDIFIICAHYDSITGSLAWVEAPGADDNGSGTAGVLAAAEVLSDYEFNCTIRFIAFGAEEVGLVGSSYHADNAFAAGENIVGVINLDMIANNHEPSTTLINMYYGTGTVLPPSQLMENVTNTPIEFPQIAIQVNDAGTSGSSDHDPFSPYYDAVMLLETKFSPYYHTSSDTIDKLNLTYCANVTQITTATIAKLAGLNSSDISPPAHTPGFPPDGGYGSEAVPMSIEVRDASAINATTISMTVNGAPVPFVQTAISMGYNLSYLPPLPFSDGQAINVSVFAEDIHGNGFSHSWEFTVDAVAPLPPTNIAIYPTRTLAEKQGLALDKGGTPADTIHTYTPSVIYHGGEYKMWYTGYDGSYYRICYANSSDGLTWTKHGLVLDKGVYPEPDGRWAAYPEVMFDGEYRMWYSGFNGTNWVIMYANSSDGLNWIKRGVVVDNGPAGSSDASYANFASVLKTDEYEMWYTGMSGTRYGILYANSTDGINWNKQGEFLVLDGIGKVYGDGIVRNPEVVLYDGQYRMYYGRYDGQKLRTLYATSPDGLEWSEKGLALETGQLGEYDYQRADQCSVMYTPGEIKIWYSAYNSNWRIMYANITGAEENTDLAVDWTPSASGDVVRYELFRETRPMAFDEPPVSRSPEYYYQVLDMPYWSLRKESVFNVSVYGPVTGGDSYCFYLPEDAISALVLNVKCQDGRWLTLVYGDDYIYDTTGAVLLFTPEFQPGAEFFATYDHYATRSLSTTGSCIVDSGAGDGSYMSYYYVIRAVDRVGHVSELTPMVGKQGLSMYQGWNLIGNPFLDSPAEMGDVLGTMRWDIALTWDPERSDPWASNIPGRATGINDLEYIDDADGVWVRGTADDTWVACGTVHDIALDMKAGWNLVSYPYHEYMTVSDALAGLPWDRAEMADSLPPYLMELGPDDLLMPCQGLWVHLTSDAVWNAVNLP